MDPELNDWEMLHNLAESERNKSRELEGVIQSDYFSVSSEKKPVPTIEDGSKESDDDRPSWVDPVLENSCRKVSSELWSDSGSDPCTEHEFGEAEVKNELGFVGNEEIRLEVEGGGEGDGGLGKFETSDVGNESGFVRKGKDFESKGELVTDVLYDAGGDGGRLGEIEGGSGVLDKASVGSGGSEQSEIVARGGDGRNELDDGLEGEGMSSDEGGSIGAKKMKKPGGEVEKGRAAWWKVPFDFLKYCALRFNPVLSLSVVAALMGVVIYGRRLYMMKRKSRLLELKIIVDDKKVSQFMSHAARLNEAFSIVRRVPVIRPSLPASGVVPCPTTNLR